VFPETSTSPFPTHAPPVSFHIFYRPVLDICAFAPRDYTREEKQRVEREVRKASELLTLSPEDEEEQRQAALREYVKPDGSIGYRDTRVSGLRLLESCVLLKCAAHMALGLVRE
jgi:hypothetical protein